MADPDEQRPTTRMLLPETGSTAPSWRDLVKGRRLPISVALSLAVLAVTGIITLSTGDSHSPAPPSGSPHSTDAEPDTSGIRRVVDGVVVGYSHTQSGAVAAAVNYETARTRPDYFTDTATRHKILAAMMVPESLNDQTRRDDDQTSQVVSQLGLHGGKGGNTQFLARAAPMGTKVISYSEQGATVEVWMAEVTGVTGSTESPLPPTAAWTTYSLTLIWEGDWKIASLSASAGPTPVTTSQDPTPVDDWTSTNGTFDAPPPVS